MAPNQSSNTSKVHDLKMIITTNKNDPLYQRDHDKGFKSSVRKLHDNQIITRAVSS